jgi:hypothetical protein
MLEKVKSDLTTLCLQRPHLEAHLICLLYKLPLNQEQNTASENDRILGVVLRYTGLSVL